MGLSTPYILVVPLGGAADNRRGRPAAHLIDATWHYHLTLCRREPHGWDWYNISAEPLKGDVTLEDVSCKQCLRAMKKRGII